MNEFEPIAEKQEKIEQAAKLRTMVQSPGWTEVFEPHIRREIEGFRQDILTGEFDDLLELKKSQQKLQYLEYMLDYPKRLIAEGEAIQNDEIAKEQNATESG